MRPPLFFFVSPSRVTSFPIHTRVCGSKVSCGKWGVCAGRKEVKCPGRYAAGIFMRRFTSDMSRGVMCISACICA